LTVLLPTYDVPLVIVIQWALLAAVHDAAVDAAVKLTEPVAAAAPKFAVVLASENCGAAAACVTASVIPAITMAPDRVLVAVLAATE
jgi:hypothetical protein